MAGNYTISVGTVGGGLSVSPDGGESWNRIRDPLPSECNIRALAVDPNHKNRIYAGSDNGLFRSNDNGFTWQYIESPMDDLQIWSVGVDPEDSDTVFVGTRPNAFRSRDGGETWEALDLGVRMPCPIGIPRTTNIIVDPRDTRTVWAGIEVDGVYRSLDGGDNWTRLPDLGPDPFHGDIHGMALKPGPDAAIYCTTPFGISTSNDEGESWELHEFPRFHEADVRSYCRGMVIKPGDGQHHVRGQRRLHPRHVTGTIRRTQDAGGSWDEAEPVPDPQLGGVLVRRQPPRGRRHGGRQHLRLRVRQHRRRRELGQAPEGVRRNPLPRPNPQRVTVHTDHPDPVEGCSMPLSRMGEGLLMLLLPLVSRKAKRGRWLDCLPNNDTGGIIWQTGRRHERTKRSEIQCWRCSGKGLPIRLKCGGQQVRHRK